MQSESTDMVTFSIHTQTNEDIHLSGSLRLSGVTGPPLFTSSLSISARATSSGITKAGAHELSKISLPQMFYPHVSQYIPSASSSVEIA